MIRTEGNRRFNGRVWMHLAMVLGTGVLLAACSTQPGTASNPNPTGPSDQSAANPTTSSAGSSPAAVSFSKDIEPIFQSRCVNCHGGTQTQRGLDLTTYASVMAGSVNGPVVVAGNPDSSLLIQMILQGKMPKSGPKLQPNQVQTLTEWVKAGAPNN